MEEQNSQGQNGMICWTELHSRNAGASQRFLAGLFGWQMKRSPMNGEYTLITIQTPGGNTEIGGIMQMNDQYPADEKGHWLPYISVANVEDICGRAISLGGQINHNPTEIPGVGRFAIITDPAGCSLAVIAMNKA